MNRHARIAAYAALLMFIATAVIFGVMHDTVTAGFSHRTHPLAWLGAQGMPGAAMFNLCGFVVPGLLVAVALWGLRPALPQRARWSARIGAQLVVLSAVGFAAQGLFPLDLEDPDGAASGLHAMTWIAWWFVFSAGALALTLGLRREALYRNVMAISALTALAVPLIVFVVPIWWPIAVAQRAAFVLWFVWAIVVTRDAVSSQSASSGMGDLSH
jgi:hypothetical membrane protein